MPAFLTRRLSRLTLGTVQLGMPYGKVRPSMPPPDSEAADLLDAAWAGGITCFDTARAYGVAEKQIGIWLSGRGDIESENVAGPLVVSKLPVLNETSDEDVPKFVQRTFKASINALGVSSLAGYLVHHADDLHRRGVVDALRALVDEGSVGAFGASVYTAKDAKRAMSVPGLGLLQGPVSVLDQRLVDAGIVDRCAVEGVTFFARSVFLQGLVFADPDSLQSQFAPARNAISGLQSLAKEANVPLAALALAAARGSAGISSLVVGVTTKYELSEILVADGVAVPLAAVDAARALGRALSNNIRDPRNWS